MKRDLIIIAVCLTLFVTRECQAGPNIRFQGETIDIGEIVESCQRFSQFQAKFEKVSPQDGEVNCLVVHLYNHLTSKLHDSLVQEFPPSEEEIEDTVAEWLEKGVVSPWTEDLQRYNGTLQQMLQKYRQASEKNDELLHQIFLDFKDQFPVGKSLDEKTWEMLTVTTRSDTGGCSDCIPVTQEDYLKINKRKAQRYLVRRSFTREKIQEENLLKDQDLRERVSQMLEATHKDGFPNVTASLNRILLEREWEKWLLESVERHTVITGDEAFSNAFEEFLNITRIRINQIENYVSVLFLHW